MESPVGLSGLANLPFPWFPVTFEGCDLFLCASLTRRKMSVASNDTFGTWTCFAESAAHNFEALKAHK